jgi:hypothetical protein
LSYLFDRLPYSKVVPNDSEFRQFAFNTSI